MANATIVAKNGLPVNFRSAPNTTASVIKKLPVGTNVLVVSEKGNDWYFVDYQGTTGYIMREFVELIPEESEDEPESPEEGEVTLKQLYALLKDTNRKVEQLHDDWIEKMGGFG